MFTAGAVLPQNIIGYRAYTTLAGHTSDPTQLVSVFDSTTGVLQGIVIGSPGGPPHRRSPPRTTDRVGYSVGTTSLGGRKHR